MSDEKMTRDEALLACAFAIAHVAPAEDWNDTWAHAAYRAKFAGRYMPDAIRTALSGGGGGDHEPPDAPDGYWWKRCQDAEARAADNARTRDDMEGDCRKASTRCGEALRANKELESRLAAAEKRAEETYFPICGTEGRVGNAVHWMTRCHDAERERDAAIARLKLIEDRISAISREVQP